VKTTLSNFADASKSETIPAAIEFGTIEALACFCIQMATIAYFTVFRVR
jgi:hypothetical protein